MTWPAHCNAAVPSRFWNGVRLSRLLLQQKMQEATLGLSWLLASDPGGGDRSRTGVQTYSPKAFYMFISLLFVGDVPETNKPIHRLAGWS